MDKMKLLQLINDEKIDEAKKILEEEIYLDSKKVCVDYKKRFTAMKRYHKGASKTEFKECLMKPYEVEILGEKYYNFLDGKCFVLTKEEIGNIEQVKNKEECFDVSKMLYGFNNGKELKFNFNEIMAQFKSKGYKYSNKEEYILKIQDGYFNFKLIDKAYSIINDGEIATLVFKNNKTPIFIENDLGKCYILPIVVKDEGKFHCMIELKED